MSWCSGIIHGPIVPTRLHLSIQLNEDDGVAAEQVGGQGANEEVQVK